MSKRPPYLETIVTAVVMAFLVLIIIGTFIGTFMGTFIGTFNQRTEDSGQVTMRPE